LINDDLFALSDFSSMIATRAAADENKKAYAVLATNAALSDTVALFHATHANLASSPSTIDGTNAPIRRTIERLLYSIAGVFRTLVGDEMADHVFENDFHPRHDPLPKFERGSIGASVADTIDDCLKKAEEVSA
jgi:hypothetical protein